MKLFEKLYKIIKNPELLFSYARKFWREFKFFDFDYRFLKGYSFPPKSICLILTERCNLRCIMCDIGQSNVQNSSRTTFSLAESIGKGGETLTLNDWKTLIDDIAEKRWDPLVLLTGTEPFLYPHLLQLIQYIVAKNLRLHITTNGTLLSRHARQLVDLCKKPDSITITISLDGVGVIHDTIRGSEGTFDKAIAGLKKITERKKECDKEWPEVNITYTVCNLNYRNMREFVQWFQEHDLNISHITFSHLWFKDSAIVEKHNKKCGDLFFVREENIGGLNISEIDMDFIHNELRALKKKYAKSPFSILEHPRLTSEDARKYYSHTTERVFYHRCLAPWRNVSVTPRGQVLISPMCFDYSIGNVKNNYFSSIWNDVPLRDFRRKLKEVGCYPACVRCCLLFDSRPKYYKIREFIR